MSNLSYKTTDYSKTYAVPYVDWGRGLTTKEKVQHFLSQEALIALKELGNPAHKLTYSWLEPSEANGHHLDGIAGFRLDMKA